jgi:hypothetical protein
MSKPGVFISHNKARPGKLDVLKGHAPEMTDLIERDKPGTVERGLGLEGLPQLGQGPGPATRAFLRAHRMHIGKQGDQFGR